MSASDSKVVGIDGTGPEVPPARASLTPVPLDQEPQGQDPHGRLPPTKARKEFDRRTARLEALRQEVARWKDFAGTYATVLARDVEPLQRQLAARRLALLRRLDQVHAGDQLSRREQSRLSALIAAVAADLLGLADEPEAVVIHDRHSRTPHEAPRPHGGPAGDGTSEPTSDRTDGSTSDRAREPTADRPQPDRDREAPSDAGPRPRSDRGRARLARAQAAAEGAKLSLRTVYRQLASALHPDREPDPGERARKTALMQQVNQAHDDRDLLGLLSLQQEVERMDPARVRDLDDERLAHYNRVLREQTAALERELQALTAPFASAASRAGGRRSQPPSAETLLRELQDDAAALRRELRYATQDLEMIKDVDQLKAWLKSMRATRSVD